jgi:hypothetical protein
MRICWPALLWPERCHRVNNTHASHLESSRFKSRFPLDVRSPSAQVLQRIPFIFLPAHYSLISLQSDLKYNSKYLWSRNPSTSLTTVYGSWYYWVSLLCPSSGTLTQQFGKWISFYHQVMGGTHLKAETDPVSETLCFVVLGIPGDGQSPEI